MGLSASGIGSGLDVNTIVSQLMASESGTLDRIKAKETSYNAKLSAYGTIKSAISTFQTALKALKSGALNAQTATSSKTDVLTASADSSATAGTYSIEVTQLAKAHKLAADTGIADATAALGSGTMSIQIGSQTAVTIPTADYSLQGLSNAINGANAGVSASIINDGTTNHLVVTSNNTGVASQITITAGGGLAQFDSTNVNMVQKQEALDATLKVDNILVTKSSNTITDAISGITLNLAQTNIGSTLSVTVARDKTAMKTAVTNFVTAYNALSASISKLTAYDATNKTAGVLNGDAGANSVMAELRKELVTKATGAGSLSSLSDIGVGFQRDGTLAADDTKLTKALNGNVTDMVNLFASSDGYATRLSAVTTDMLSTRGVITSRMDGLKTTIKGFTNDEADENTRLDVVEKRYRAQFTALDTSIASMKSTSTFLTQQLAAIAANN